MYAGATHFKDLWARDALYASWGALAVDETQPVLHTLQTLEKHQKDGQIPLRVGRKSELAIFLGLPSSKGAVYKNDKTADPALDPNSLYVITAERYTDATGKSAVSAKSIEQAMEWLANQDTDNDSLLEEGSYASWDDCLKKRGASIYNNACYYGALRAAAKLTGNATYIKTAKKVRKAANEVLWNGSSYDSWKGRHILDVAGNLLAIEYGMTNATQTNSILSSIAKDMEASGDALPRTNYPAYPWTDVYFPFYLVGMGDYHNNGPYWTWIAALDAKERLTHGDAAQGEKELQTLGAWVNKTGVIELYSAPEKPLHRLFYSSETDFTWGAGMILYATTDRP